MHLQQSPRTKMSNSVAPSQPSSGWRRMSDKLNMKKTKIQDCPTNSIKFSEITALHHEVEAITDFRMHQDTEEYLVSWRSDMVSDVKASWESETVIEAVCKDALLKFWMKIVLSEGNEEIHTNLDNSHNLTSIFKKKLWNWVSQPVNKEATNNLLTLTPSKKRPRQYISDDELDSSICEIENKHPKLSGDDVGEKFKENFDIPSTMQITTENDLSEFYNISKPNEMYDLIETPQCEVGEIITFKKNVDDETSSTSCLVGWLYVANETPSSLGLSEKDLREHYKRLSLETSRGEKCLLYRKKCHKASIKVVPCMRKSFSPRSDSDQSELSTVPPSESGTVDSGEYRMLTENFSDVECQTSIELDPYACSYCQSRKGEDKRLSSLRQRKSGKEEEKAVKKNQKTKKNDEIVKLEVADDGANEEDDDDMVSIEYEVEKILNYRQVEGTKVDEYYIRWKGFTSFYDTWEPYDNLSTCDKALILFYVDRVAERKNFEEEMKNGGGKKLVKPPLPPIPEVLMEELSKKAPVSNEEIEMAYKVSKTIRKNGRWTKTKLRKTLLDLIGESIGPGSQLAHVAAQDELPVIRHQLLMLESERRKELIWTDLKDWEKRLNYIARGRPEIVVENNYDLAGPPADFKYINDNVLGEGVTFPATALEGCNCEESCLKDKSKCCPGKHDKVLAYNSYKRLRVYPGYPIYECNKQCKCGPECANRVVQDGTMSLLGTKLCIFRTSNERGWGVKTLKKIKRGTFVCLYAGEIITSEEAESRGQIYENLLGASYLFDLDYYAGEDDLCPYTIDATKMGNVAHFINHSCEPNLCVFNVWADCVDQNLPKLAFFALRDINKDEELTYDYGTHDEDPNTTPPVAPPVIMQEITEDDDGTEENSMVPLISSPSKNRLKPATASGVRRACLCGASSCRKVLF